MPGWIATTSRPSCAAAKSTIIQQVGSRVCTDEQAKQHAEAAIQLVVTRERALIIEPTDVGNRKQDQGPHCLDVMPALDAHASSSLNSARVVTGCRVPTSGGQPASAWTVRARTAPPSCSIKRATSNPPAAYAFSRR